MRVRGVRKVYSATLIGVITVVWTTAAQATVTPEQKCQAAKNLAAGKYALCLQKAEKKLVLTGDSTKYDEDIAKCQTTYQTAWQKAEQKAADAGGACTTTGDQATVQTALTDLTSCLTGNLGGTPATCDLTTVQGELNACNSNLTWYEGAYNSCQPSLDTCDASLAACYTDCASNPLAACEANLAICQAQGSAQPPAQVLRTGQTLCWDGNGYVIACGGTGQDGDLQKGVALAYTDNADGTITDNKTGLMWEKKVALDYTVDATNPHDADNCYPWSGTCGPGGVACGTDADCGENGPCQTADCQTASPDGLTIFKWVAQLNTANFAGHNDWRIPNVRELQSILDYNASNPAVAPAFNGVDCGSTCTDITSAACSCTGGYWWWYSGYWSSTTQTSSGNYAWYVEFYNGGVSTAGKGGNAGVRAVRGGS